LKALSEQLSSIRIDEADWGSLELSTPGGAIFAGRRAAMVHIVLSGSVYLSLHGRDELVELKAGSSAFIFGGYRHSLLTNRGAPATTIRYFDEPQAIDRIPTIRVGAVKDAPVQICLSGAFEFDRLATVRLMEILPEMAHGRGLALIAPEMTPGLPPFVLENLGGPGTSAYMNRLADYLLVVAIRRHGDWSTARSSKIGARRLEPEMVKAIRLMRMQPAVNWTVAELAGKVMMSRSAFATKFTESIGEPPMAYLTRIRMNRAAELVARTDQPLASIANSLGYASFSSFTHLFKRWHGKPPGKFRREPKDVDSGLDYLRSSHWQVFM
jgi:AraC-like DNA-binding protein